MTEQITPGIFITRWGRKVQVINLERLSGSFRKFILGFSKELGTMIHFQEQSSKKRSVF